jgi:hypothetical protein
MVLDNDKELVFDLDADNVRVFETSSEAERVTFRVCVITALHEGDRINECVPFLVTENDTAAVIVVVNDADGVSDVVNVLLQASVTVVDDVLVRRSPVIVPLFVWVSVSVLVRLCDTLPVR